MKAFLSHSSHDRSLVLEVYDALNRGVYGSTVVKLSGAISSLSVLKKASKTPQISSCSGAHGQPHQNGSDLSYIWHLYNP